MLAIIGGLAFMPGSEPGMSRFATIDECVAEIERLRARAHRAHDALRAIFWEGGIDQEDAQKVQSILRGDDEQKPDGKK